MKKAFGIFFIFTVGIFLGFLYSESRNKQTETRFQEANDSDYNNKEFVEVPSPTVNPRVQLPSPRPTVEKKSDPDLPKAPVLLPDAKPKVIVNIQPQKNTDKKPKPDVRDAYTISIPGLSGTVKLSQPHKPTMIRMTPECRKEKGDVEIPSETIVANATGGLANVFVSIKSGLDPKAVYAVPTEPVVLDQTGCLYTPHVFAVRVGQPFQILNSDPFLHNVNGMPKVNPKFNNGMPTKGSRIEKKFTNVEERFRIKCDVHPWMSAYGWVVDHPFYTFTDAEGKFNIPNLPYGEYTVQIQHELLGNKEKKVVWGPDSIPTEFLFN